MTRHDLEAFGLDAVLERALSEDVGAGDLTTEACIDPDTRASALAVARSALVACGGPVFERVFRAVDASLVVTRRVDDGAQVTAGATLWAVEGRARSIRPSWSRPGRATARRCRRRRPCGRSAAARDPS